jgi:hypothetical protein
MPNARDFTSRLAELLRRERSAMADFLLALADFDAQQLWRELGHASLFSFLRRELGLSAGAAQYRKTAAELVRHYPEVEAALRSGVLCLSSVIEIAKVLTPENVGEVLPRFFGLSARDAASVAVSIRPVRDPPRREIVTALAVERTPEMLERTASASSSAADAGGPLLRTSEVIDASQFAASAAIGAGDAPSRAPSAAHAIEPLDAGHARLHVTVSRRFLAKLDQVKDALSHAKPGATSEEILEACMDLMLARCAKRKGLVERPRDETRPPAPGTRTIPAAVKREAWSRSGGRCEWPLDSGGVCGSTLRLEFDHVTPHARGGPPEIHNVRVLCRQHNQLAARLAFGDEWLERCRRRKRTAAPH